MKTKLLFIILALSAGLVFAQKESANWYFGEFAGLNFNTPNPTPLLEGQLATIEGCATISDRNGTLLFYTDGVTIWDRRHQVMPNGQNLLGHSSSTASALIVPKPGSLSRYYVFTIDKPSYFLTEGEPIDGVNYSEVDLSLNGGFGDVVVNTRNRHLITYDAGDPVQNEYKSSEKITAVSHGNGSSIWVITQFMDKFYAFLVNGTGVNETPVVSNVSQMVRPVFNDEGVNITAIGYLKVSPNGKKIAIAHSSTNLGGGGPRSPRRQSGRVLLYDFNNATGIVSNDQVIIDDTYPYGVEFSPNSKLLYITNNVFDDNNTFDHSHIFQYNLEAADIAGSVQGISNSNNVAGALQLAINGKIYRSGFAVGSVGLNISVINSPNTIGAGCDYSHNTVSLGGKASQLGLPPFVQSIFRASFDYENACLGNQTHFFITSEEAYDSVLWDFGNGDTSTNNEPNYTYDQPGIYTVSLTLTINGIELEPFIKEVIITEPIDVMSTTFDLVQCDSFDNDPNDGITTFNLEQANAALTFNTSEGVQAYYYHSIADAQNDLDNSNALNNVYENQYQNEILYAKIYKINTDCYNIASIRLVTSQSIDLNAYQINACAPPEEIYGDFDLLNKSQEIASDLNLPTDVVISFYESESDAAIGVNALPEIYNSSDKTIFVRAESNNACYGTGTLNLSVKPFPRLEDQTISVCSDDFPISISSGVNSNEVGNYNYDWSTMATTDEALILQPGDYLVSVTDPVLNCGKTVTVTVKENEIPEIQELDIESRKLTVLLEPSQGEFVFALDSENGIYQESNTFFDIPPGQHTVFASDINGCHVISQEFYIFGFPKYFTPNGDGTNDTWNAYGLKPSDFESQMVTIKIYDRYGKLLKTFNPLQTNGWNGRFNGQLLAPDDYWYYLKFPDGKEYRGHFTLKI